MTPNMDNMLVNLVHNVHRDQAEPFSLTLLVGGKVVDGVLVKPLTWFNLQQAELGKVVHTVGPDTGYLHLIEARVEQGANVLSVPLLRVFGERVEAWSLGRVQAWEPDGD